MYLITWITIHLPTLRDGWLSWPCWMTDSGRLNHKVVTQQSGAGKGKFAGRVQRSITTMLRRQQGPAPYNNTTIEYI